MYKTFALYKEERSFDVLQGNIPSFVYGDVKLAIQVDGNKQTDIPNKKEDYVVEPKCDNGEIEWDYENWAPIIKNITKETRCSLNFVTNNSLQTLGSILTINNLNSIDTLLTNGNIDKLVASKEGMTYLAKSPTLVNELQSSTSYNEDIKKKILDSEVISEDLKYEAGLPCYLLKNKQVLKVAGDITLFRAYSNYQKDSGYITVANYINYSYYFGVVSKDSAALLKSTNQIDIKKYKKMVLNYGHRTDYNAGTLTGTIYTGMNATITEENYQNALQSATFNNYALSSNYTYDDIEINLENENMKQYFYLGLKHGSETTANTVAIMLNTIALY